MRNKRIEQNLGVCLSFAWRSGKQWASKSRHRNDFRPLQDDDSEERIALLNGTASIAHVLLPSGWALTLNSPQLNDGVGIATPNYGRCDALKLCDSHSPWPIRILMYYPWPWFFLQHRLIYTFTFKIRPEVCASCFSRFTEVLALVGWFYRTTPWMCRKA